MSSYRVAIAGAGSAAGAHARAYRNVDAATVVACSSLTEDGARSFADEHDCEPYVDVERMLDGADPDVLSVCTPAGVHRESVLAAAERGVDVLCEKPLEITTERIDDMLVAADEAGIRLGGIFQRRYKPVVRTVREAVADGRFGPLAVASATLPWWRDDSYYDGRWQGDPDLAGGGVALNQAIHSIDALQWVVGAGMDRDRGENPVAEVFAHTGLRGRDPAVTEVEDTAVVTLRFRDGTIGNLRCSTAMYPGGAMEYELGGREGTASVRGEELTAWEFREERDDDAAVRERFSGPDAGGDEPDPLETANAREFLSTLESGEPFMLDGVEARIAVAIVEAVYESAERGEPVAPS